MSKWFKMFASLILSVSLLLPGYPSALAETAELLRESITKEGAVTLEASTDTYEPNDTISAAYASTFNKTLTSYISTDTDQDMYRPYSSSSGVSVITLTVPSGVDYDLWLYDEAGNLIKGSANGPGESEQFSHYFPYNKKFYVQVTSPNHTFDASLPYTLNFGALDSVSESYEPNEIFETAYLVNFSSTSNSTSKDSYLSHEDDVDFYKMTPDTTGMIGVEARSNADLGLAIYDHNRQLITETTATISTSKYANVWVNANETYYVKVYAKGTELEAGPYTLTVTKPRADSFELNDSPDLAYPIETGTTFTSHMSQTADIDYYALTAKDDDKLAVTFTPRNAYYTLAVYEEDATGGLTPVANTMPNSGASHTLQIPVLKDKRYLFKVNQNNVYSLNTYTLSLSKYVYQNYEPNNTSETAAELPLKKLMASYIDMTNDVDYYRFMPTVSFKHHLTVKVPTSSLYQVRLLDSQLTEVAVGTPVLGQAHELEFRAVAGQTYFVEVTGVSGSYSADDPYVFCISPVLREYDYDPANRLLSTTLQKGTHLQQLLFTYDDNGNLLRTIYSTSEVTE